MKILHTADWHLGRSLYHISMLEEQESFIHQLLEIVKREQIELVLVAGDIFDSSVSASGAIALYNQAVTALCNQLEVPVVIIAGNHDGAVRLTSCSEILKKSGLYLYGKVTLCPQPVEVGDVCVYPIPFFNMEEIRQQLQEENISTYQEAMEAVTDSIRKEMDPAKTNVALAHCFVSGGALSDSDQAAMVGMAAQISAEVFRGFDYVALGHLHRAQKVGETVYYSGSPLKYSVKEEFHEKSVTVFDTVTKKMQHIPILTERDVYTSRGTFEECYAAAEKNAGTQDFVKVEITDQYAGPETILLFRQFYPNLLGIEGKNMEEDFQNTLTVEEIERLAPEELVVKFCREAADLEPDENMIREFMLAYQQEEKEELQ